MNRSRGSLAANVLLAAVAAGTTWMAMSAWRGLDRDAGRLPQPAAAARDRGRRHRHRRPLVALARRRWSSLRPGRGHRRC